MENVVECENGGSVGLYSFYTEIVAWATGFGLIFPAVFLFTNTEYIPWAVLLGVLAGILMVVSGFLFVCTEGKLFPWLKPKKTQIRWILYGWGLVLLSLAACLVYYTGGIQSSIFVWLFAYAVIVTILIRPKDEQTRLKQWRPVLFTGGFEVFIIGILVYLGGCSIQIPHEMEGSMPIWGGISAIVSVIASCFLFYVSDYLEKEAASRARSKKNV